MWTLSDSGFSSRSGLSPLVDLVVLLYEEYNQKIEHIREIREEIESFFKEHIDQWRSDYPLLDRIIKFFEVGLANYEVVRSLTQVSITHVPGSRIRTNIILGFWIRWEIPRGPGGSLYKIRCVPRLGRYQYQHTTRTGRVNIIYLE